MVIVGRDVRDAYDDRFEALSARFSIVSSTYHSPAKLVAMSNRF